MLGLLTASCTAEKATQPTSVLVHDIAAQNAASSAEKLKARETIIVHDADGSSRKLEGENLSSQVLAQIGSGSRSSLDSVRKVFVRYGAISKRGKQSVALTLRVIDALQAGSREEFHRIISELPVEVVTSNGTDASGQAGVWREYRVNGIRKLSVFRPFEGEIGGGEISPGPLQLEGEDGVEDGLDIATRAFPLNSTMGSRSPTCEYTDPDNVYYSGECATQQELDDAAAATAAMVSDVDGVVAEVSADSTSYCLAHQEDYEYCAEQLSSVDHSSSLFQYDEDGAASELYGLGGPSADCAPTGQLRGASPVGTFGCHGQGVMYASAIANWGFRLFRLNTVVRAVAPPVGAVVDAIAAGILASAAVVGAGMILSSCME